MMTQDQVRQFLETKKQRGVPKEQALRDLQNALSALQAQQPKGVPADGVSGRLDTKTENYPEESAKVRRARKIAEEAGYQFLPAKKSGSQMVDFMKGVAGETGEALSKTASKLSGGLGYLAGQASRILPGDQSQNPEKFQKALAGTPIEYSAPESIGGKIGGGVGEVTGFIASEAPSFAAGAGAAGLVSKGLKAKNLLQGTSTAAKAGRYGLEGAAAMQAAVPTSQGRLATIDETVLGGAALGAAFPVAGKILGYIGKTRAGEGAKAVVASSIIKPVKKYFEKAVQPQFRGSKKTITGRAEYMDDADTAVKTIVANKKNLNLVDDMGDAVKNELPENLNQFEQAVHQTKQTIFKEYNSLAKEHGTIPVNTEKIADNVMSVAESKKFVLNPEIKAEAERYADMLRKTDIDIAEAEDLLQHLNTELKSFYAGRGTTSEGKALIKHIVANNLRRQLNEAISNVSGVYSSLKKTYGSLAAVEKDVTHRALVDGRKAPQGFFELSDIFSAGQLAKGVAGDPLSAIQGGVQIMAKRRIKFLNDKNVMVKKMFQGAQKELEKIPAFKTLQQEIGEARVRERVGNQQKLLPEGQPGTSNIQQEVNLSPIELPAKTPPYSKNMPEVQSKQPLSQNPLDDINSSTPKQKTPQKSSTLDTNEPVLQKTEKSATIGDDISKTKMTAPKELIEDVETTASKMKKEGKTFDDFLNKYNGLVDDFSSLRQKRHKLHARQDIDTAESQLEEIADIVENIYKKTGIAGDEALYVKNLNKKINNTMMDDEYFDFENASITQKGQDKLDEFIEEMNESVELYMREFENITGIKDLAPSGIARNREFGGQANYVSKGNLTIDEWLNDIWRKEQNYEEAKKQLKNISNLQTRSQLEAIWKQAHDTKESGKNPLYDVTVPGANTGDKVRSMYFHDKYTDKLDDALFAGDTGAIVESATINKLRGSIEQNLLPNTQREKIMSGFSELTTPADKEARRLAHGAVTRLGNYSPDTAKEIHALLDSNKPFLDVADQAEYLLDKALREAEVRLQNMGVLVKQAHNK